MSRTRLAALCRMIKIEHSVFALPFAYCGLLLSGSPTLYVWVLLTIAMVAVRTFAMTANRLYDLRYDKLNPRTQNRQLVTGEVSVRQATGLLIGSAALFMLVCAGINSLCFMLSPLALAIAAGYSLLKRFTWLCHFALGVVLGLAPLAGWISLRASFALPPFLLFLGVLFWVAGFDILYATQDTDFDMAHNLHSIPSRFGIHTALALAAFCHMNASLFFLLTGVICSLGPAWYITWMVVSLILLWEHKILSPSDLSRVNTAFFFMNGIVSVLLFFGMCLAVA